MGRTAPALLHSPGTEPMITHAFAFIRSPWRGWLRRLALSLLGLLALSATFTGARGATAPNDEALANALKSLTQTSFITKAAAVKTLEGIDDERVLPLLHTLLSGDVYYRKSDKQVVYAKRNDDGYQIRSVLTGADLGQVGRRDVRRITINNQIRVGLREAIARLSLNNKSASVRLAAVNEIMDSMTPTMAARLRERLKIETSGAVREAIEVALALVDMNSDDKAVRLKAITVLGTTVNQTARNRLAALLQKNDKGEYMESDAAIRKAAAASLASINQRLQWYSFVETGFFGLSLGSVLLLSAIGLAITFGVMGVINMAHGELMMLGAYTTYVVQLLMPNHIGASLFVAIPAAFLVSGLFGIAIERGVIRFLYGRPLETLLATFGISLVLQQLVRTIFSPLNRSVETPAWMSGSIEFNSALSLTYNRLYIIVFALLVFAALLAVLKKTSLGLQVRAVSQNRAMARAMGVRTDWVDALTFGLGSGIAGVAGVALSQLTNVGPNLGQSYIIDSFMVVVFGGVGNLWGTLVGAMSLGVINKFLEPWSGAVLAKILVLVFIILFIQKRPRGLFPQKGRAAEH